MTLHNTLDPVVPFWHEEIYADLATPSWLFVPTQVEGYGHCEFSSGQILEHFLLLQGLAGD